MHAWLLNKDWVQGTRMDDIGESLDSSVIQEHFLSLSDPKGNLSTSSDVNICARLNRHEKECCSKNLLDSTDSKNALLNEVQDVHLNAKQVILSVQETASSSPEESDHHVPCSRPEMIVSPCSPIAGLVPISSTNTAVLTHIQQEQNPPSERRDDSCEEEVFTLSESSSGGHQLLKYTSGEEIGNYHFMISQDQGQCVSDDDSCDVSYLQNVNTAINSFNQQYQDRREDNGSFSPEAFLSSIPLFKELRKKRPTAILPKLNTTDPTCQYEHCLTGSHGVPILPKSKPHFTVLMHDSAHGVPIAPRPDPNTMVSCYVLVVPTPIYYENFVPQECLQLQQEQQEDMSATAPSEPQDKETEIEATSDITTQVPQPVPMHPPDWTPKPPKLARTPLPSTRVRVSPSPHKGSSRCSPLITVSTTATPIPPLQGNKQQYVIVQGNHRHLKGIASYKDSLCTPSVEGSHPPIYLQGLPPQGFRRLWKAKENACTENPTKRSLEPLFSEASASVSQEAIVPQMEKSPLTCIRDKIPWDREVPEPNTNTSPDQRIPTKETPDVSASTPAVEETTDQDTVESELLEDHGQDQLLELENDKIDEVTIIPVSQAKSREDKERKKIRDRKYDADLKKAFEQLRRMVPRMQKSYSRGLILQETIKYIGILEKKVLDAGLRSSLQTQDHSERNTQSISVSEETVAIETQQESVTEAEPFLSPIASLVPDMSSSVTSTIDETPTMLPKDERGSNPQKKATDTLTSPLVLSLSTEEGPCSFVSAESAVVTIDCEDPNGDTFMVEEVPLSLPFQQFQLLPLDPNDTTHVLTPQSSEEPLSQEPNARLIPVVEVPGYTENDEYLGVSHISPRQDVLFSAMTTISHEVLSDLGVTLSPLLSPLGILLSPGGDYNQESTIAVVVEDASSAVEENVVVSNGVIPGVCTDMTSVAASVEVTTDQRKKWTSPSNGRTRRSPRLRAAQTVPSISSQQAGDCKQSTPHSRKRHVLQDHSNFEDPRSPVAGNGRARRRTSRDGSPEQSFHNADENSAFSANQTRTPPGRVSGVILSGKRKTHSSRGRVDTKRFRRF